MVDPAGCRVHKPSGVELSNPVGQLELGVCFCDLAPALVVNDLQQVLAKIHTTGLGNDIPRLRC